MRVPNGNSMGQSRIITRPIIEVIPHLAIAIDRAISMALEMHIRAAENLD
jgi:hypothetical protein